MAKSPAIFQLSRSLQSYLQPYADMGTATLPPVFQATGGMDFAGLNSAMANAQSLASEPLWQLLGFPSEDAWIAAGRPTSAPPKPAFSSSAQAAPATGPAVAPESQPAKVNVPSQGAGTQYTQGMTTLPPGSTLPSTAMPSGAPQGNFSGQLSAGNIDLDHRPVAPNGNAVSTVRSITIEEDGKQILIPTVAPDGTLLSNQQAIDLYHKTGQNLGTFDTQQNAETYANALHNAQAARYSTLPNTGLANATAGVAGPGEVVQNKPSLLSALEHAVTHPLDALKRPMGYTATGTGVQEAPSAAEAYHNADVPAQIAGHAVESTIPGAVGRVAAEGARQVLNPINLALLPFAPEGGVGRALLANAAMGASSQGAKEAGAPPLVQMGAGFAGGAAPSLIENGVKGLVSGIKEQAPQDLTQQLKDATVQTVAKTINEAKNPEDVVNMIRQLDYAQRMALTLEVGQNDKTKMLELSKLLNAAEAGDIKAASQLQSGYFRDTAVVKNRASALSKAMDALGAKGPVSAAVEDTGAGGFTPSNPIERALGRSLSQSEQEYINGLPPDRLKQLMTEANAPNAAEQAAQAGVGANPYARYESNLQKRAQEMRDLYPQARSMSDAQLIRSYNLEHTAAADTLQLGGMVPPDVLDRNLGLAQLYKSASAASRRIASEPAAPTSTLPENGPVAPPEAATAPPSLAKDLQGAKPRYNYGTQGAFTPTFASDVEKAAYITAQATKSKRDADYLQFVMDATGLDEAGARQYGQQIRAATKAAAQDAIKNGQKDGALVVPSTAAPGARVAPPEAATTPPAPAAASTAPETPLPVTRAPSGATMAPNVTEQALADKAAAAGGAPPKPPVTDLPLGPSGGGSLPRDLKSIGMSDDANAIVQSFRDSYAANVAKMSSEPSTLRNVTSAIGGDLKDPKLAELVNSESQLNQALFNHLKSNLIEVNVKGMDPTEAQDWILQHQQEVLNAAKQADDATKAFRADALRSQYSGAEIGKAQAILGQNDIMRATSGHSIYDKANNLLKEVRFGVDVGTVLQQDLKAARVGGTAALSGVVGNIASAIKGDSSRLGIYPNSAITREAQQMADNLKLGGIRTVGVEPMSGGNIASKAINTLTNVQYQGLTKVRQSIYEGLLYQNKLLGRDISDPVLRRQIADFANMATSTGNIASNAGRALLEKRVQLSPQMTRSQFAELAQPIKGLTSLTQAINTANQLAATAATFGVLYGINQAIGSPMSLHQFLSTIANPDATTFGRITLKARDDSGNRLVWDALPQFSTERAILKSIQETQKLAKGDANAKQALLYLGDTAARYTFGRTNIVPQMALNAAGVGYAPGSGKFHYGDMPLVQRAESAAPVPLSASQAATQNTLPWKSPVGFGLNIAGGNSYAESKTSLENRYAQKQYGQDYSSLNSLQQAAVNVAARQDGNNVTDATAIRPWWTAGYEDAWSVLQNAAQAQNASPILKAAAKYKDLASFMADVQAQAQKDNVPYEEQSQMLKTAASKIDQALQSTLGMDYSTIQQKLRVAALRKDPSIYPAVIAYYQANGYAVPKWLADLGSSLTSASPAATGSK